MKIIGRNISMFALVIGLVFCVPHLGNLVAALLIIVGSLAAGYVLQRIYDRYEDALRQEKMHLMD